MLIEHLGLKLKDIASQHLTRKLRVSETPTSIRQVIRSTESAAREMLLFCSNDYLGLASHIDLAKGLIEGASLWSGGSGASHLISGHTIAHENLDLRLAKWFSPFIPGARALSFSTGYMANIGLATSLGDAEAEFFSDELNHASLIDGMRLAKASVTRYSHNDTQALRRQLAASTAKIKLIVSDTIFSMDGDIGRLPELLKLAEEFDAWLILDDAHGFGVLGKLGRGALEHFGLRSERILLVGTLGKAAGLSGAFVVANSQIIEYLIQTARTYIFTTSPLPAVCYGLQASLDLIEGQIGQQRRIRLQTLQRQFREGVLAILARHPNLGWRLTSSDSPIQPLIVGENETAMELSSRLESHGIRVPGIRPPTVPAGQSRLRITLCATHTEEDVFQLLQILASEAQLKSSR